MALGLIIVDIQNDYFKGGKHELVNAEQAAIQAKKVLTLFREKGWMIFHVRHLSTKPGASFFIPGTEGSEINKDVCPIQGEDIIIKHKPDSFLDTSLKEKLEEKGVDTLVVCGMMTHMCIDTTVRSASSKGYPVTLLEDACATRDLVWRGNAVKAEQVQNAYLSALDGSFAKVLKYDEWVQQLSLE
ncbi:MAG: cysteine hydrolase family protein [Mobilitalea sp.]